MAQRAEALRKAALAAAIAPPARPRIDFEVAGRVVGSVQRDDARLLARKVAGLALGDRSLSLPATAGVDAQLAAIALALREAGRLGPWRNEALPVLADDDAVLGCIERAAARTLGLRTLAVHLLGWHPDGRMWVQRRAPDKAVDPGRLDTLAGGLVGLHGEGAGRRVEALADAMRREADEEAGVPVDTAMRRIDERPLRIMRPVAEGYMVEDITGFEAGLDAGFEPANRDGEVAGFECLGPDALVERVGRGEFTLEASLLVLGRLRPGGHAGS